MPCIGIIGSKTSNCINLKEIIFKAKKKFGNSGLIVYTGGNESGVELDAKRIALSFELQYKEFNPVYTNCNLYSVWSEACYRKPYSKHLELDRYLKMCGQIDYLIFVQSNKEALYKIALKTIMVRFPKLKIYLV